MNINKLLLIIVLSCLNSTVQAQEERNMSDRALWGSIAVPPGSDPINLGSYQTANNKVMLTWRMLPGDDENTAFDLYRKMGENGTWSRMNGVLPTLWKPIYANSYVHAPLSTIKGDLYYRLTYAGDTTTIGSYVMKMEQAISKVPYIEIPLKTTEDVCSLTDYIRYQANDCSVGDLDGDGQMEIVVKRLLTVYDASGNVVSTSEGAADSDTRTQHVVIWDAYKLDGTFMWRVMSGPNIIAGNSSNFAVADLDGDGCCEMITKTGEGTIFGDGYVIPDTDGDNKTDYRDIWPAGHYTGDGPKGYGGPEFFSVIDGKTGKELARANFICRGKEGETPAQLAANWYQNDWKWDPRDKKYQWKLANSLRLGVANFTGHGTQIFLGRGVYGRTIVEGWQYDPTPSGDFAGTLTRLWKIDTDDAGGKDKNKDGKLYSAYAGQGNHSFNVADLDGDGLDEVMYGSCAWDNDGTGLWSSGLGHGDANHVGRFLPDREGLQVYHCLESGVTMVALHDAKDGKVIWKKDADSANDMGRCMVADVDPSSPGCEFWYYGNELFSQEGKELYSSEGTRKKESSANAGIWFDGSLSRQMINEGIIHSFANGRTFTIWRYGVSFNNSSKSNPGWYGDMLGDWREEIILPSSDKLTCLRLFSTWYPTKHRIPWLMTDHTYKMQTIHQQVGYNQPNNLGYYLGSDYTSDADIWAAAEKADEAIRERASGVENIEIKKTASRTGTFNLMGQKVQQARHGLFIVNGRKVLLK